MPENLGGCPSGAPKPHFGCEGGHSRALDSGAAPTNGAVQAPGLPVAQRPGSRETPRHNHGWLSFRGVSLSPSDPEPRFRGARGVSRSLGEPKPNSAVRNPFRSDYFKSGCEQQPSPNARETRPPRGRVFRFVRRDFEGWARAGGRGESRSLNHVVARIPPLADRMGRKSLQVSPPEGAGLRQGRARWSGHYPRGRERWGGGGQSTSNTMFPREWSVSLRRCAARASRLLRPRRLEPRAVAALVAELEHRTARTGGDRGRPYAAEHRGERLLERHAIRRSGHPRSADGAKSQRHVGVIDRVADLRLGEVAVDPRESGSRWGIRG